MNENDCNNRLMFCCCGFMFGCVDISLLLEAKIGDVIDNRRCD